MDDNKIKTDIDKHMPREIVIRYAGCSVGKPSDDYGIALDHDVVEIVVSFDINGRLCHTSCLFPSRVWEIRSEIVIKEMKMKVLYLFLDNFVGIE